MKNAFFFFVFVAIFATFTNSTIHAQSPAMAKLAVDSVSVDTFQMGNVLIAEVSCVQGVIQYGKAVNALSGYGKTTKKVLPQMSTWTELVIAIDFKSPSKNHPVHTQVIVKTDQEAFWFKDGDEIYQQFSDWATGANATGILDPDTKLGDDVDLGKSKIASVSLPWMNCEE